MDSVISCSVNLPCDVRTAFNYFIENELLQAWLTSLSNVEPKLDGKYELFWLPEDKENNSTIGCKVTAFKENSILAFEWKSPMQFKHFANSADPLTHVVVSFIPSTQGTSVYLVHSGWRSTAEWQAAKEWQQQAWAMAFKNLNELIVANQT